MKDFKNLKGTSKVQLLTAIANKYEIHPHLITTYLIEEINVYPDKYLKIYIYDDENNKYEFRQNEIYSIKLNVLKTK